MDGKYVVVNFESDHWPMNEAKRHDTKDEAVKSASRLARKYQSQEYFILQAIAIVRFPMPPVEVVELEK